MFGQHNYKVKKEMTKFKRTQKVPRRPLFNGEQDFPLPEKLTLFPIKEGAKIQIIPSQGNIAGALKNVQIKQMITFTGQCSAFFSVTCLSPQHTVWASHHIPLRSESLPE